jgi:hypothetical protein
MSGFAMDPIDTVAPFLDELQQPSLEGAYCQSHGLTSLGELLIAEIMLRGMILEIDHLPQRSYMRAFEILEANDYPAAGTHGSNFGGRLYAIGGPKTGLGCAIPLGPADGRLCATTSR